MPRLRQVIWTIVLFSLAGIGLLGDVDFARGLLAEDHAARPVIRWIWAYFPILLSAVTFVAVWSVCRDALRIQKAQVDEQFQMVATSIEAAEQRCLDKMRAAKEEIDQRLEILERDAKLLTEHGATRDDVSNLLSSIGGVSGRIEVLRGEVRGMVGEAGLTYRVRYLEESFRHLAKQDRRAK